VKVAGSGPLTKRSQVKFEASSARQAIATIIGATTTEVGQTSDAAMAIQVSTETRFRILLSVALSIVLTGVPWLVIWWSISVD
jgi:hypothetical protein